MFREKIKVFDCTIRDGGLINEHPKAAMALRNSDKKENYREFYESLAGGLD